MRIGLSYNLRQDDNSPAQAELLTQEDIQRLTNAFEKLNHDVVPLEVTGTPRVVVEKLIQAKADLIFNLAEGLSGETREAYYPAIYRSLNLPFTGSESFSLNVGLNKRLTNEILKTNNVQTTCGTLITQENRELPEDLKYPVIIKPNFEGSSKGISQDSIAQNREEAEDYISNNLKEYPNGLSVESFIEGRELTLPWLESWPGGLLEIVEWNISHPGDYDIMDYEIKNKNGCEDALKPQCPAKLSSEQKKDIFKMANKAIKALHLRDFGRIDIRLDENNTPYLIEANPLPGLRPSFSMMIAGRQMGLEFEDVIAFIIKSAANRYGLKLSKNIFPVIKESDKKRLSVREAGIKIGRFDSGEYNAITDVAGVKVGHITRIEDIPADNKGNKGTAIRTGITAVVPSADEYFDKHLIAGGFILNGIGEMSGLTQAMEWGWLETPILLTNTMSIGAVHQGVIEYMLKAHPELGDKLSVIIPLIGETDDSFLNDVRTQKNQAKQAITAIEKAKSGPVEQGSVGGGTGMISFDFAGGIGSSSRVIPNKPEGYTIAALVQSNFGKMRNLTVEGKVVGKELDLLYPYEERRVSDRGSVIVVLATDAPLTSTQLNRISKRAALGLGRVGSYASATSGEIVFAFSTANQTSRLVKENTSHLNITLVTDNTLNLLYEAAIEATEEAVLNAMFYSEGMSGRLGREAPPIPINNILDMLKK